MGVELTFSDCVMPVKRSAPEPGSEADEPPSHLEFASGRRVKNPFHSSSVTLSGLLNAIDGVASQASAPFCHLHVADIVGRLGIIRIHQFPRQSR